MSTILLIICILAFCFSPFIRCFCGHIFQTVFYSVKDVYSFIRYQKWKNFNYFGIYNFVGMFGKGKTLSATEYACRIYRRFEKYGKKVRIISNYDLKDVPYIPLISFQQVVDIAELSISGDEEYCGTILLIDEIENILSHRKFASFPMELMHTLTQQRKAHLVVFTTLQRWHMCDKCWRDISTWCVDCLKVWRFERLRFFDGWDIENALNSQLVRPKRVEWFFIFDRLFNQYDTTAMITKHAAEDFISNDEVLTRRGSELMVNQDAIKHPSIRLKKARRVPKQK